MHKMIEMICCSICVITFSCSVPPAQLDPSGKIIVDNGPFSSAEDAAHAEAEIDWNGDHHEEMNACTQSFAAVELCHMLCKLSRESDDSMYVITELKTPLPEKTIVLVSLEHREAHSERPKWIQRDNLSEELTAVGSFALIPRDRRLFIIGADRADTRYGEQTIHFYDAVIRAIVAEREGDLNQARIQFRHTSAENRDRHSADLLVACQFAKRPHRHRGDLQADG